MNDSSKPPKQKKPKLGAGHLKAMARQGLKELQASMYAGSNVAREPEIGTFGNPGQGEIAADRRVDDQSRPGSSPEHSSAFLDAYAADARSQSNRDRTSPSRSGPELARE